MDFELPADDDPRRVEVRAWLAEHPSPSGRELAAAGLVAPHWPKPYGLDADPVHQLVIDEELRRAGVARPANPVGIGWAGPTLLHAGTQAQQERYLPPLLSGDEIWCQLFSEPGAGSDLASLTTRAVRDGDEWVVTGQKIWTSLAHEARFGILIARTDPEAPKHRGISYFVCPMDAPGVTVRPIVEMTGAHMFNEVFLDDVRLSADNLVGEEGRGWELAKVTLANERVSLRPAAACGAGGRRPRTCSPSCGPADGSPTRCCATGSSACTSRAKLLRLIRLRTLSAQIRGEPPGPEASVRKVLADEHGQRLFRLAKDIAGAAGMLTDHGPLGVPVDLWHYGFLFAPALTVGGGTGEVQRNIIGERALGLPHD